MQQFGEYGITCYVCSNLLAIITNKVINMLPVPGEWLGVPPEDFGKVIDDPSLVIDLIEDIPEKEASNIPKTSIKVQEVEATKSVAKRFISIVSNIGIFFFTFKLGFNIYI